MLMPLESYANQIDDEDDLNYRVAIEEIALFILISFLR